MTNAQSDATSTGYRIGLPRAQREPIFAPPHGSTRQLQRASWPARIVYAVALLSCVLPLTRSGWVMLTLGGGALAGVGSVVVLVLGVYRIALVLFERGTLDAPVATGLMRWLRIIGLGLAGIGIVTFVLQFFIRPLGRALAPHGSDNGIEFYMIALALSLLASLVPTGLLLFEFSRLRCFEKSQREDGA